jgi:hypothetical protein
VGEIKGRQPYAAIDLSRRDARLYVTGGEESGGDVFLKLEKVIAPRQRRWPFFYSFPFLFTIIVLNSLYNALIWLLPNFKGTAFDWVIVGVLGVAGLLWTCWLAFIRAWHHAVIRLRRHSEIMSFLQRNKDAVTVAIITAIIVGLIAYFVPKLADKFFKPGTDTGHVVAPTTP